MQSVFFLAVFFSAGLAALLGLSRLVLKHRLMRDYYLAVALFSAAIVQLLSAFSLSQDTVSSPFLVHWHIPALLALGPALFQYIRYAVFTNLKHSKKELVLFLPAALGVALVHSQWYQTATGDLHSAALIFDQRAKNIHDYVILSVFGLNTIYFLIVARKSLFLVRDLFVRPDMFTLYLVSFQLMVFLIVVLAFLAFFLPSASFLKSANVLITVMITAGFLLNFRYPELFIDLGKNISQRLDLEKYKKSRLSSLDLSAVAYAVQKALKVEQAYLDDKFSLAKLAQRAGISQHQMSEYLNTVENKSFAQLLSEYRVREAQRLLATENTATVLEIAFASGFSTKSTFNSAFVRLTGMTPQQYRAQAAKSD